MRAKCIPQLGVGLCLWLSGCSREVPRVGLVVSSPAVAGAQAAARVPGPGAVELRVRQPQSATGAEVSLAVAESLVADEVIGVVGHSNSAASLAASQVYNRAATVQLAPTTTATVYEQAGEYSFRMVGSDREQAKLLLRAARVLGRGAGVAVMYENDTYGWGLYRDLRRWADSAGVPVVAAAYLSDEPLSRIEDVLEAVLRTRPGVLLWLGRNTPLESIHARLASAGVVTVASDGLDNAATYTNHQGVFTDLYFVRLLDPAIAARAAARLTQLRVSEIGAEGLLAYDAVGLLRAAVATGARSGAEVHSYLMSLGRTRAAYEGVTGAIQFDETRSVQRPWRLARVTAAGVVAVELEP